MIGRTLAHYRILERIGAGGMGEVFLALDVRNELDDLLAETRSTAAGRTTAAATPSSGLARARPRAFVIPIVIVALALVIAVLGALNLDRIRTWLRPGPGVPPSDRRIAHWTIADCTVGEPKHRNPEPQLRNVQS